MNKPVRKAVRTYLIKDNNIVVIKYKQQNEGYYDIPGGKIEENENSYQASIREFKEETGIDIIKQHYIGHCIIEYPEKVFDFEIYTVDDFIGDPVNMIENDSMWINIEKLKNEEKIFATITVISYLNNKINVKLDCDNKHNVIKIEHIV